MLSKCPEKSDKYGLVPGEIGVLSEIYDFLNHLVLATYYRPIICSAFVVEHLS